MPRLDAHHRFLAALAAGAIVYFFLGAHLHPATRILLAWDGFAACLVALAWIVITGRDPYDVRRSTRLADASSRGLFALVITAAVMSLFAVGWMLRSTKTASAETKIAHLTLGLTAVGISWILTHTLFALRYARQYYEGAKTAPREAVSGGLLFPGKAHPDYLDFAYFSFIIGMTCQVSDVQITTRPFRHIALLHGFIAFIFNTAILAMLINIVAGML